MASSLRSTVGTATNSLRVACRLYVCRWCSCACLMCSLTMGMTILSCIAVMCSITEVQWGKKVFSQPPIVQVLTLKKMRGACNCHRRYTSTMTDKIRKKSRKSHCRIFYEFICKLWWKISIQSSGLI